MSAFAIVAVTIVALVAALAYINWTQRRSLRWPSDDDCLRIMQQEGVDLSRPHMLEFWLNFPSREAASSASPEAVAAGFEARVFGGGPGSPTPGLVATKLLLPTKAELSAVRTRLTELAGKYGGNYMGCFPRA